MQAWIQAVADECRGKSWEDYPLLTASCGRGPSTATDEDRRACAVACVDAIVNSEPNIEELPAYREAVNDCFARVDATLGRGEVRCFFRASIPATTRTGDPHERCETACREHAAEVRRRWSSGH
jgi:hypothetical protein